MKVAIVYDRVNKWGGAERVLLTLHEMFPSAPLYTSVYNPETAQWANIFPRVYTSFLQKIPHAKSNHEDMAPFMPLAFESFNFDRYDLVISVTSEAAKGIITKPKTFHICYCLTPTRYLWSHYSTYFPNKASRVMLKPLVSYLKAWDKIAAQRPDVMVSISTTVRNRIKKYYGRDSEIIFPPVEIDKFKSHITPESLDDNPVVNNHNFYLVVSRLVSYKKVDLVVKAFNELGYQLIIVGIGREEQNLKNIANSNITFVGNITDSKLIALYQSARALIFPQEEDFGLVAVEAQAAGTPVITYYKGGSQDTVNRNITGVFFYDQTSDSLVAAVREFEKTRFTKKNLIKNADRFDKKIFITKFQQLIKKYTTGRM